MQTCLVRRPGNGPLPDGIEQENEFTFNVFGSSMHSITSFNQLIESDIFKKVQLNR